MQAYSDVAVSGVRPWWNMDAHACADALANVCHPDVQQDVRDVVLGAYGGGAQCPNYVSNRTVDYLKVDDMCLRDAECMQQLVLADIVDGEVFDPRPGQGGREAAVLLLEQAHAVVMSVLLGTLPLTSHIVVVGGLPGSRWDL